LTGATEPDPEHVRRYNELYAAYTGLYPALRASAHALAGLAGEG